MQWASSKYGDSDSDGDGDGDAMNQMPDAAGDGKRPPGAPGPSNNGLGNPPPYSERPKDPRTSSTQSLVSSMDSIDVGRKRTLLVVYIHGFMGNNSSFQSFPAHVHIFLKDLLAETHSIHTKIYPRYKTYKSIDVARDNFSSWLAPHESPTTDVVLVGHSMGGLLAAEIVLLPTRTPNHASYPFGHRILGTISLDAPLLGLHPGIVVSGIASLFRPSPSPSAADGPQLHAFDPSQGNLSPDPGIYSEISPPKDAISPSLSQYPSSSAVSSSGADFPDPYFNPRFSNDVAFVDRGWFKNIAHFAAKHKEENIFHAAANHITSHLEFGGCMADYPGLKSRYNRLRMLEDVDEWHPTETGRQQLARVRFINYYTVSTGLPKTPKPVSPGSLQENPMNAGTLKDVGRPSTDTGPQVLTPRISTDTSSRVLTPRASTDAGAHVPTPRISVEDHSDGSRRSSLQVLEPMQELDPIPEPIESPTIAQLPEPPTDGDSHTNVPTDQQSQNHTQDQDEDLPTIPPLPTPPTPPDLQTITDKAARKQAEKDYKTALKDHASALKARDKAIKAREKALEKQQRKSLKDAAKRAKQLDKDEQQLLKERLKEEQQHLKQQQKEEEQKQKENRPKKQKLGKFCMLPSKDGSGRRDPAWVEVYMRDVDEVGAHCGLFVEKGPHYERLVGDVGERIAGWVREDASRRVILEGGL